MDQSPYLVQALQSLQQPVQAPPQQPDAMQLAQALKRRQSLPGALKQAGQNLMDAPGNVVQNLRSLPETLFGPRG